MAPLAHLIRTLTTNRNLNFMHPAVLENTNKTRPTTFKNTTLQKKETYNFYLVTETPDHVYVNSACSACRWEPDTRAATVSDPRSCISSGCGDVTSLNLPETSCAEPGLRHIHVNNNLIS